MSYQPYDRNPSGVIFFGTNSTDQTFESASTLVYDSGNNRLGINNATPSGSLHVDNLQIDGNTLSAVNTSGNIYIQNNNNGNILTGYSPVNTGTSDLNTVINSNINGSCHTISGSGVHRYATVHGIQNTLNSALSNGSPAGSFLAGSRNKIFANGVGGGSNFGNTITGGYNNVASGDGSVVSGGVSNEVCSNLSAIGGGGANTIKASGLSSYYSNIGGGYYNSVSGYNIGYATIGGGQNNCVTGARSVVAGGCNNRAYGSDSTISGGYDNCAGDSSVVVGGSANCAANASAVVGGFSNTTGGSFTSFIGAGAYNEVANGLNTAIVAGTYNVASGDYSAIVGGQNNSTASAALHSFIGGGHNNTINGPRSTIGGGCSNTTCSNYSTISGGYCNRSIGNGSSVGGGRVNLSQGMYSTVSGGYKNCAIGEFSVVAGGGYLYGGCNIAYGSQSAILGGLCNSACHAWNTIGGGGSNTTTCYATAILGGFSNLASGDYSVVVGGRYNTTSAYYGHSFIGAGLNNIADGYASFVGAGCQNAASGDFSVVVGGNRNLAQAGTSTIGGGSQNQAYGNGGTISGGSSNKVYGCYNAIGGGSANTASEYYSSVAGGYQNRASGDYATVVGGHLNFVDASYASSVGYCNSVAHTNSHIIGSGITSSAADTLYTNKICANNTITGTSIIKSGGTSSEFLKADGSVDSTGYTTCVGTVTSVAAGNGMNFGTITTTGSVALGTPSDVTLSSTNSLTANSHTHAFAPGGDTTEYIRGDGSLATFPTNVASGVGSSGHIAFWTATNSLSYDNNELFWDQGNNRLGIGTNSPTHSFTVNPTSSSPTSAMQSSSGSSASFYNEGANLPGLLISMASSNSYTHRGSVYMNRSRGTLDTPTAVQDGDWLGSYYGAGYDGSALRRMGGVIFVVDGAVSSGSVPTSIMFQTGSSSRTEKMRITHDGKLGVGTASPSYELDIAGSGRFTGTLNVNGDLIVNGTTTTVNSTVVTIEDPILVLGSGTPTTDDNKDRGIAFNYFDGSAKQGFFGYDDNEQKFTFMTDATIAGEVASGIVGTIKADLNGNADTATILETTRTFSVAGDIATSSAQNFNGSANVTLTTTIQDSAITSQDPISSVDGNNDLLLIYESGVGLKKVTPQNLIDDLNIVTSFNVSDGSTDVTVQQGETLSFADGDGAEFVVTEVSGEPTVTVNVDDTVIRTSTVNGQTISQDLTFDCGTAGNLHGYYVSGIIPQLSLIPSTLGSYVEFDSGGPGTVGETIIGLDGSSTKNLIIANGRLNGTVGDIKIEPGNNRQVIIGDNTYGNSSGIQLHTLTSASDAATYFYANIATGGNTVYKRSTANVKSDLGLSNVENIAVSTLGGSGLYYGGNQLNVGAGNGITVAADSVALASTVAGSGLNYANGVLNIGAGSGIGINSTTIGLTPTNVTAASYGSASSVGTFTVDANGRLTAASNTAIDITASQVSNFNIASESAIFTSANFVDSSTIDFTVTAGASVTAGLIANSISESYLTASVAGSGLSGGNGSPLSINAGAGLSISSDNLLVNVDGTTIEIDSDTLRVKSGGIDTTELADGAVTEAKLSRTVDADGVNTTFSNNDVMDADINLVNGGVGGITVKLPAPATGKMVYVKKIDSEVGAVTVARNGTSDSIDGATQKILYSQYESLSFVSDGTHWYIV